MTELVAPTPSCFLPNCYSVHMTTVDLVLRYAAEPSEAVAVALAKTRDVYGIRRLTFDRGSRTLCVEYDATRLNAAAVTSLMRNAGLQVVEEVPLALPPAPPKPASAT